jgi:hypothetical protein
VPVKRGVAVQKPCEVEASDDCAWVGITTFAVDMSSPYTV